MYVRDVEALRAARHAKISADIVARCAPLNEWAILPKLAIDELFNTLIYVTRVEAINAINRIILLLITRRHYREERIRRFSIGRRCENEVVFK